MEGNWDIFKGKRLGQWGTFLGLVLGFLISMPHLALSQAKGHDRQVATVQGRQLPSTRLLGQAKGQIEENRKNLPPEEEARRKRNIQKWKSLSPDERKALRRRMDRWKQLPPEDRALFRQRFQQWRDLSPEERQRLREQLERWDRLSPKERDDIRRRFRNP